MLEFKKDLENAIVEHQKDYLIGIIQDERVNPSPIEVAPLLQAGFIKLEEIKERGPYGECKWYIYKPTTKGTVAVSSDLSHLNRKRKRFEDR